MLKLHKDGDEIKFRPVTDMFGSLLSYFSKWLSEHIKSLLHFLPTQVRDSQHFIENLMKLGKLPRYARLFTVDAVAMYTNIELDTALDNITKWLLLYKHELPKSFPNHKLFLTVLKIVMSNSVFKFGDKYFIQEQGTAMGTPCAGDYANIHVGYRERTELLPTFEDIIELLKRFIDDKGGVWSDPLLPPNLTNKEEIEFFTHSPKWQKFVAALPGGGLE